MLDAFCSAVEKVYLFVTTQESRVMVLTVTKGITLSALCGLV